MPPRMCYLAYPIDQVASDVPPRYGELVRYLNICKDRLLDAGVDVVYDPGDAFCMRSDAKIGPEVAAVNQLALQNSDSVLALLPSNIGSIGVPMEIAWALEAGKVVALISDRRSWALGGLDNDLFAMFGTSSEDFAYAVAWLSAQERQPRPLADPLPYVVIRPADCGSVDEHEDHIGDSWACLGLPNLAPRRAYEGDAGWDLTVAVNMTVKPNETVDIPCGISVAVPDWGFGRITGRSSTLRKRGLLVNEGIIDSGWRGELFTSVRNLTAEPIAVLAGERLGQLIIHANDSRTVLPVPVEALPQSDRGKNGFGSTGL